MRSNEPVVVRVRRSFDISPEEAFDAFVDPSQARRFLFRTPAGEIVRAEVDGRAGGTFVITERRNGEDVEHLGRYVEFDRPRRLAFMFKVPKYASTEDRVAIDFIPSDRGCDVVLTHDLAPEWEAHRESARQGWEGILDGLVRVLNN